MPIDYSKWDKLDVSSSDDDDEAAVPRVTRLDEPGSVTFGGGSGVACRAGAPQPTARAKPKAEVEAKKDRSIDYSKWDNLDASSSDEEDDDDDEATTATRISRGGAGATSRENAHAQPTTTTRKEREPPPQERYGAPFSWSRCGSFYETTTEHGNDDEGGHRYTQKRGLYWTQDRYEVTLRYQLHETEKVTSVGVDGILPYRDRCSAVGSAKPRLTCRADQRAGEGGGNKKQSLPVVLLEGSELPHPVHLAEEDDAGDNNGDDHLDWSVVVLEDELASMVVIPEANEPPGSRSSRNSRTRFLVITLRKAVPVPDVTVWWRRPLVAFPEVDLETIRNDDGGCYSQARGTRGVPSGDFRAAWEEAHRIFRAGQEKRKQRDRNRVP